MRRLYHFTFGLGKNGLQRGEVQVAPLSGAAFSRVVTLATHSTRNIPKYLRIIAQEIIDCVGQSVQGKK